MRFFPPAGLKGEHRVPLPLPPTAAMQRLLAQLALGTGTARRYRTRSGDEEAAEGRGMARAVFEADLAAVAQLLLRGVDPDAPDRCARGTRARPEHGREHGSTLSPPTGSSALTRRARVRPRAAAGSGRCCWR